jgi:GcrA cell cycle regulator
VPEARPHSGPITVEHLKEHHCRWPVGNPYEPDFHFCGAAKEDGPYCDEHRALAYIRR